MTRQKPIYVLQGRAKLFQPTETHPTWRVVWNDPVTGKRKQTSGGRTRETAEAKAADVLGEWIEGHKKAYEAPTVEEAWEGWKAENGPRLSTKTIKQYDALARHVLKPFGTLPVTAVTPKMLNGIDLTGMKRQRQTSVKHIVKGIFETTEKWTRRDAEDYAKAIRITGRSSEKYQRPVSRGDIPSGRYIAACINTAYGTCQISPIDPPGTTVNPLTGDKKYTERRMQIMADPAFLQPDDHVFLKGLPDSSLQGRARRRIPPQYQNRLARQKEQTDAVAKAYRNTGLAIALGAGAGLRIGEVLSLRVRHLLTREQCALCFALFDKTRTPARKTMYDPRNPDQWHGRMDVLESIGVGETGTTWITKPKMGRQRTVHAPAFLPNWTTFGPHTTKRQMSAVIPRLGEPDADQWTLTREESIELWKAGFIPLGMLLWDRLEEIWLELPTSHGNLDKGTPLRKRVDDYLDCLIFPTSSERNKTRRVIMTPDDWPYDERIVEGTGGFLTMPNFTHNYLNPLLDYVSEQLDDYPEHKRRNDARNGWTFHGFRHYAASSRVIAGTPMVMIARELGHANPGFTLQRYGHMLPEGIPATGFSY